MDQAGQPGPVAAVFIFVLPFGWLIGVCVASGVNGVVRRVRRSSHRNRGEATTVSLRPSSQGPPERDGRSVDALPAGAGDEVRWTGRPFDTPKPIAAMTGAELDEWIEQATTSVIEELRRQ